MSTLEDTYWQIWVFSKPNLLAVYLSDIPIVQMNFETATRIQLKKIQKIDFLFVEFDYTNYFKIFQRQWRIHHRMRKRAFKYLRMREVGLYFSLG
jgi:hypothetical protein